MSADWPVSSYVICATQRSGSNVLCEALWFTGVAGKPDEYFLDWWIAARAPRPPDARAPVPPSVHLQQVLREGCTPNGVFGVKIMYDYFGLVIDRFRAITGDHAAGAGDILATLFPALRYIHITRRDKIRQAVSLAKALQSGRWTDPPPERLVENVRRRGLGVTATQLAKLGQQAPAPDGELTYDFDHLAALHRTLVQQDEAWEIFFRTSGIIPHRVVYEDFVAAREQVMLAVLRYLNVPQPDPAVFPRGAMRRQGDALNDEWAARFAADLARRES